jgi:hypothetical protein
MPRRPARISRKTNPRNSNRILKRAHNHARASPPPAKSRNMQKPHTAAVDRRMVRVSAWAGRSPQRNGAQRLPLRPHSSRPCTGGLDERGLTDQRGAAPPLPLCPKETAQNLKFYRTKILEHVRGASVALSISPRIPVPSWL